HREPPAGQCHSDHWPLRGLRGVVASRGAPLLPLRRDPAGRRALGLPRPGPPALVSAGYRQVEGAVYVPLWVKSNFSFLEGASHPDELVETCVRFGLDGMAITDRDGVYGAVRAH